MGCPTARVMVAGWCLETDRLFTPVAHTKGLTVQFGGGPHPQDFDAALRALGDGEIDIESWITHEDGLDGRPGRVRPPARSRARGCAP
ncbi:MAG TPA: hypothetical protein VKH41_12350 [Myxococcota bacterium]|nr:hypothetical protein [Myxococcota bacterium]